MLEIPTHWELKRAKQLFKTIDVRSSTGKEELLSVTANLGVVKRADANVTMFKAESYIGYKLCWPEDLAVNSLWAWQKGLGFSWHHGIISTAYSVYRLRNKQGYNYKYYNYYVRSSAFSWELRVRSKGIWRSRYQLLDVNFFDSPMICPPKEEQNQIVRYLDSKLAKINKFIRNKKRLIELLKEQKQAVINQAVTKGLDPDAKMKPSGVDWLGDVPERWKISKLGYLGRLQNGISETSSFFGKGSPFISYGDVYNNECLPQNIIGMANSNKKQQETYSIKSGDVLFTRTSETIEEVGLASTCLKTIDEAVFSGFLIRFRPYNNILDINYSKYYFRSHVVRNSLVNDMNVVTRASLSQTILRNVIVILPPKIEQKSIHQYLEEKIGRIEKTIDRIRKEIDLITEYRISLISAVVTGKVDVRGIEVEEPPAEDLTTLEPAELEADEIQEE